MKKGITKYKLAVILIFPGLLLGMFLLACTFPPSSIQSAATATPSPASTKVLDDIGGILPFENLSQGETFIAELEQPTLFVANNPGDAIRFTSWLDDPEIVNHIQNLDYESTWVVALFRGMMGSSGYEITIQKIERDPQGIQITAQLTDPPADQAVSDVISYPYHIVLIPRQETEDKADLKWSVLDQEGALLAETIYP